MYPGVQSRSTATGCMDDVLARAIVVSPKRRPDPAGMARADFPEPRLSDGDSSMAPVMPDMNRARMPQGDLMMAPGPEDVGMAAQYLLVEADDRKRQVCEVMASDPGHQGGELSPGLALRDADMVRIEQVRHGRSPCGPGRSAARNARPYERTSSKAGSSLSEPTT